MRLRQNICQGAITVTKNKLSNIHRNIFGHHSAKLLNCFNWRWRICPLIRKIEAPAVSPTAPDLNAILGDTPNDQGGESLDRILHQSFIGRDRQR
jgi:hypothetical protein